jgi:hypothetical protein
VQQAPGIPCALFFRANEFASSGAMRRENAEGYSVVIVREGGRSSIPEAVVIEPISRGVLDTRLRGYDDRLCGEWIASLGNDGLSTQNNSQQIAPANELRLRPPTPPLILPNALLNRRP